MRAVVQRVRDAAVRVDGATTGAIARGLLVYLGVGRGDSTTDVTYVAGKIAGLRIFPDDEGRMNRSLADTLPAGTVRAGATHAPNQPVIANVGILTISQFTLYGDVRKGRRPSYNDAAMPEDAERLYDEFVSRLREHGYEVATGVFGAHMDVSYTNDGPVTIIVDSESRSGSR